VVNKRDGKTPEATQMRRGYSLSEKDARSEKNVRTNDRLVDKERRERGKEKG
jgi:hypothetical protein